MEPEQIIKWCGENNIDARKSIVLSGVPLSVTEDVLYNILDWYKKFGQCKIRGQRDEHAGKFVLIETTNDMTTPEIPEKLEPGDDLGIWVVNVIETQSVPVLSKEEDFQAKLVSFLANEGKTLSDITGLLSSPTPAHGPAPVPSASSPTPSTPSPAPSTPPDLNTQLVNAISSLVERCQATPVDGPGYRKIRLFSGMRPTPSGEEEYEAWAEQTIHMVDEWQCSDVVKKQRIAESLKGPAADIVRCLRVANPHATANDYLKALETAFGTTDSAADLMVRFRNTSQQEDEKLSAYLLRLDKLLHAVHRKGGIEVADMNRVRIEQVARGALPYDLAALRIRMTYKLKPPPSFTELLRDVREEEGMTLERLTVKNAPFSAMGKRAECATASIVPVQPESAPVPAVAQNDSAIESLRKEFQGLKNEVARLLSASVAASESTPQHAAQNYQVYQPKSTGNSGNSNARGKERAPRLPYRADFFCYRCGEDGHFLRECQNPENLRKVNMRLLKAKQPTGNSPGAR